MTLTPIQINELRKKINQLVLANGSDKTQTLSIFRNIQNEYRYIPDEALEFISEELDVPKVQIEGAVSFYHFFSSTHRGKFTIYMNTSTTSEMKGCHEIMATFETELGIRFGETTEDQMFGLYTTSCIGMCDQEPAAIINECVFTDLTIEKVKKIIFDLKSGKLPSEICSKIKTQIQEKGPVFFSEHKTGDSLKAAMEHGGLEVIEMIKSSGLRGRGGAGFPTGQKWGMCRATEADARYVFCNVDEGEPGTFKDRVLLTEKAELIFEGMIIAGYAIEAKQGFVYLRAEYAYLLEHLENVLKKMRDQNLLGKRILGTRFSFDIHIKLGAGAYICGEESALIESAEGKRGQPRNRPPFPVVSGYLHKPTIVNNPETYGCAAQIVLHGSEWFKKMGTSTSSGVKLFSVSGDCEKPGIYELPWGLTIHDLLKKCNAKDTLAVQVGGPSGNLISEKDFNRKLCYSDLSTGGAITIYNKKRDLFSILHNHIEFFARESCGFCVPCRAGNVLLLKQLEKIMIGNGSQKDIEDIKNLGRIVKSASRCGLGQSSPNPLLTAISNFSEYFKSKVRQDVDFMSQFNMDFAIAESVKVANRKPNLEKTE